MPTRSRRTRKWFPVDSLAYVRQRSAIRRKIEPHLSKSGENHTFSDGDFSSAGIATKRRKKSLQTICPLFGIILTWKILQMLSNVRARFYGLWLPDESADRNFLSLLVWVISHHQNCQKAGCGERPWNFAINLFLYNVWLSGRFVLRFVLFKRSGTLGLVMNHASPLRNIVLWHDAMGWIKMPANRLLRQPSWSKQTGGSYVRHKKKLRPLTSLLRSICEILQLVYENAVMCD